LVQSPFTTSGQEMERVYSYNPGARTGPKVQLMSCTRPYSLRRPGRVDMSTC